MIRAGPVLVECVQGDIAAQHGIDAVVCAANPHLTSGAGVAGAIHDAAGLLASCFRRSLELADQAGLESVAFPAISTGLYGYPVAEAARVSVATVQDVAPELRSVRLVRFVLWKAEDLGIFERTLSALQPGPEDEAHR